MLVKRATWINDSQIWVKYVSLTLDFIAAAYGPRYKPGMISYNQGIRTYSYLVSNILGLNKMANILQTTFSDAFSLHSWMKIFELWVKFHWNIWGFCQKKQISRVWICNNSHTILYQCSKLLPVRLPEADNFGGRPATFFEIFFNFMFMIWDSRQEDWQLFWLSFEHWLYGL